MEKNEIFEQILIGLIRLKIITGIRTKYANEYCNTRIGKIFVIDLF